MTESRAPWLGRAAVVGLGVVLWIWPVPEGLAPAAWHLFAIFAAAIASVVAGVLPILTASILAGG